MAPGLPTIFEIIPSQTSLRISWFEPSETGGSPITEYHAYVENLQQVTVSYCSTKGELSCTANQLIPNTQYKVIVSAWNSAGGVNRSSGNQDSPRTSVRTLGGGVPAPTPTPTPSPSSYVLRNQTITFSMPASLNANQMGYGLGAFSSSGLSIDYISNTLSVCTVSGNTLYMESEGACSVTAMQGGSANYLAATSVTRIVSLSKGTQTINFAPTSTLRFNSGPYSLQATASSGLTVSFANNSPDICALNGKTLTMISLGICSISASQSGNGLFAAAPELIKAINMTKNGQYLEISNTGPGYFYAKTPFTVSAYSSYGFDLNFTNKTEDICTLGSPRRTDITTGQFKVESLVTMVKAGYCTITARVSGNEFYDSVETTRSFLANMSGQTIDFYMPTTLNAANFPYNLSATSDSGLPVSYAINSSSACTLNGNTLIMVSAGYCFITAYQNGDLRFNAAQVQSRTILLSKGAAVINIITPVLASQLRGDYATVNRSLGSFTVEATANSGSQPYVRSYDAKICTFTGLTLNFTGVGYCGFNIIAPATELWGEATSRWLQIYIKPD